MYHKFAKLYGWTPATVDQLSLDQQFWLPVIADAETSAVNSWSAASSD